MLTKIRTASHINEASFKVFHIIFTNTVRASLKFTKYVMTSGYFARFHSPIMRTNLMKRQVDEVYSNVTRDYNLGKVSLTEDST